MADLEKFRNFTKENSKFFEFVCFTDWLNHQYKSNILLLYKIITFISYGI
jgi:hypothetical protein